MATQYAFGKIVTNGLVLALDAADKNSYPGSGTTWRDLSGNSNNGTFVNGVGFDVDSLSFDGVNDTISISNSTSNNISGNITLECWINRNASVFTAVIHKELQYTLAINANGSITYADSSLWNYASFGNHGFIPNGTFNHLVATKSGSIVTIYLNGNIVVSQTFGGAISQTNNILYIGSYDGSSGFFSGRISNTKIYNRALSASEVQQNYNAQKSRNLPGSFSNPFLSPVQAQSSGYSAGSYYFKSGAMSSPLLLEYQPNYYENKPFCCVFRSPYRSTATTNRIDLNIPMGGLLVQRDALDLRGAVYWSTPITYNSVGGNGNNTADSGTGYAGSNARRVMLGFGGGHGIYNSSQQQCNWGNSTGGIGAGWDSVNCGVFPNDLVWGTGNINPAYENRSGTWSHWITWN
jgi:hypothetical protein